jgi:twitching motility protein PilT
MDCVFEEQSIAFAGFQGKGFCVLKDIDLKDIYVGRPDSWIAGVPGTSDPIPAPADCLEELEALREMCDNFVASREKDEFTIRYNDVAYRASVLRSVSDVVYVLRRFPSAVPPIGTLGIHPGYVSKLMQPGLSGLIVIAGAFGQGKTTTASSVISSRLGLFGGVAITIEDPPEMPLEGRHGNGVCYQTWVDRGQFGDATRKCARYAPSIIFLGEVRDSETAAEALRASINGRLVICTTHADSVTMAIERLYSLANGAAGNSDDTASLLAGGLLCVLHQKLEGDPRRPKVEFLWLGDSDSVGVRNIIRQRRFEQVGSEVTLQLNRMMMGSRGV